MNFKSKGLTLKEDLMGKVEPNYIYLKSVKFLHSLVFTSMSVFGSTHLLCTGHGHQMLSESSAALFFSSFSIYLTPSKFTHSEREGVMQRVTSFDIPRVCKKTSYCSQKQGALVKVTGRKSVLSVRDRQSAAFGISTQLNFLP